MRKRVGSILSLYGSKPVWNIDFINIIKGDISLINYCTKLLEGIILSVQKDFYQFTIIKYIVKKVNNNFFKFYIYY
jgi:hypothetical protein